MDGYECSFLFFDVFFLLLFLLWLLLLLLFTQNKTITDHKVTINWINLSDDDNDDDNNDGDGDNDNDEGDNESGNGNDSGHVNDINVDESKVIGTVSDKKQSGNWKPDVNVFEECSALRNATLFLTL